MDDDVQIGPVPRRGYAEALRFIAGGDADDEAARTRAEVLDHIVRSRGAGEVPIWWGRRGRKCAAAALVMPNPGHVGMLFASHADAPGVDAEILARVVRSVATEAVTTDKALVQALTDSGDARERAVLEAAGFECIADLITLRLNCESVAPPSEPPGLIWREYGQFGDDELMDVIERTYRDSLDCPGLAGVRSMRDVIEGHKNSGIFRPDSWWLVGPRADSGQGAEAGVILVNDTDAFTADLVYMGVTPEFRGRGIGAAMVQGAAHRLRRRGITTLSAAVDAANIHARRIYERLGFRQTQRRLAHMLIRGRAAAR